MDAFFPSNVLELISLFSPCFGANHFNYFQGFMLGYMLLGQTRKCVTNIAQVCFFVDRHVASWERFLATYPWSMSEIQKRVLGLIQEEIKDKLLIHGAYLAWLDTSLIGKVKGKMIGVQKWHDHSGNPDRGDHLIGHHWALAGLVGFSAIGAVTSAIYFPLLANLISGQINPLGFVVNAAGQARVMDFWSTVCPLMAQLHVMLGPQPMRVVADAFFAKASFINWMLSLGIHVVTRMRKDAVGWDDPEPIQEGIKRRGRKPKHPPKGRKWKLAGLLKSFPAETLTATVYGKLRTFQVVCRDLWITGVESQRVRVVVIKNRSEPFILLSTNLNLSATQIIEIYGLRFGAELAIRDLKQHFGLGDYQCTTPLAILRYVGLALVGFCLWRLTLLKEQKAESLHDNNAPLSFTRISRSLRSVVMQGIFQKSAQHADLHNFEPLPKELARMIV